MPPKLAKADRLSRLRSKAPIAGTYDVVLDADALSRLHDARREVGRLELAGADSVEASRLQAARDAVEVAEAAAADAVEVLHLHGLSRSVYEALQAMCPPTDEQQARKETYDVDTFLPALIAAVVVEDPDDAPALTVRNLDDYDRAKALPGRLMSAVEVDELLEPWNQAEVATLWNEAVRVCTSTRSTALPFGSGRTRG